MEGEFNDMNAVATRMAYELMTRFPDALVDMYWDPRNNQRPRQFSGPIKQVIPVLQRFCCSLPRAWIKFEPDHPYGMVLRIVGHCDCPSKDCKRMCKRFRDRPEALLTLTRVGAHDVSIGGYQKPSMSKPLDV